MSQHTYAMASAADIDQACRDMRASFNSGLTRPIDFRRTQLRALLRLLDDHTPALLTAIYHDLRKPRLPEGESEIAMVRHDLHQHLDNLDQWAAPEYPSAGILNALDTCVVRKEPLGVVLVIGPWNYPVNLILQPLVGAIAAGNTVVVKPSELAPATAALMAALLPQYVDTRVVRVLNGGVPETTRLLEVKFDHIFYTGSTAVGRIVMMAAAKNLTPVTLELGGKSPAIVADDVDVDIVARRLAWGKCMNAGQTCIAPDYILCSPSMRPSLVDALRKQIEGFYGVDAEAQQASESFARIISESHWDRLDAMLTATNGKIAIGGVRHRGDKYISPTVVTGVKWDDAVMRGEIFGPIFPVLEYDSIDEAIAEINARDPPLSLYLFTKDKKLVNQIVDRTRSGGVVINDVIMHVATKGLPFGGVGESGMGSYHGKYSFDAFSHRRSMLWRPHGLDIVNEVRYAPYVDWKARIVLGAISGEIERKASTAVRVCAWVAVAAVAAVAAQVWRTGGADGIGGAFMAVLTTMGITNS